MVRPLTDADIGTVFALCRENRLYYEYCPPFVTPDSIRRDMEALPPGRTPSDKHYLGYFDGEKLTAVLDLIEGYPRPETAFIGFFMTDISVQGSGIGSFMIGELCSALRKQGFEEVRLGWVRGNPQAEAFWHRNGFTETGASWKTERYTVTVGSRSL